MQSIFSNAFAAHTTENSGLKWLWLGKQFGGSNYATFRRVT